MSDLSLYLNIKEPKPSTFGTMSQRANAIPSTGEVVGAFVEETFAGDGSLSQDINASNIRKQEARGVPLKEEDWKGSDSYRDGLTWHDGITEQSAKTLASIEDDRANRQLIMSRASTAQTVAGFGSAFVTGIFEPKNFAAGAAVSLATLGMGQAIPTIARLTKMNSIRKAAAVGAGEGVVAAGILEPSNLESAKTVQGDYTLADSLMNVGLSVVLGAGLTGGGKALELRGRGKKLEALQAYRAERPEIAVAEFDTALAQTIEGRAVDVTAVKETDKLQRAQKAKKELPKIEEEVAAKQAQAKKLDATIDVDVPSTSILTEEVRVEQGLIELDAQAISAGEVETVRGGFMVVNNRTGEAVFESFQKSVMDKVNTQNYTVVPSKQYLEKLNRNIKDGKEDYKNVLSGPQEPKLSKEAVEIKEVVAKKKQALSDASQPVDTAPIKAMQERVGNAADSSAYDADQIKAIQAEKDNLSNLDDPAIIEQEFTDLQEELRLMEQEGQLTNEDTKQLEALARIDEELDAFDNIFDNARLCLTRG